MGVARREMVAKVIHVDRFTLGAEFAYDSGVTISISVRMRAPEEYDPEQPGDTRYPPRELCKRAERGIAQALADFQGECMTRGIKL